MKPKYEKPFAVHELCRKLKIQLDELSLSFESFDQSTAGAHEEKARRSKLMERLKQQLAEFEL